MKNAASEDDDDAIRASVNQLVETVEVGVKETFPRVGGYGKMRSHSQDGRGVFKVPFPNSN